MPRPGFLLSLLLVFSLQSIVRAQTASIGGKVLLDGKPAANILVVVFPDLRSGVLSSNVKPAARGKTDIEGRFQFDSLQPGKYDVLPHSPAHVLELEGSPWANRYGKSVVLEAGETRADLDFKLRRGGVITGRVTNADGKPVIGERVHLQLVADDGRRDEEVRSNYWQAGVTDDRGVYRYYGLRAGIYRVGVGLDTNKRGGDLGAVIFSGNNRFYPATYHPAASVAAEARLVEVNAGQERENIDIRIGEKISAYKVSGRVVSAETEAAIEGLQAALRIETRDENDRASGFSFGGRGRVKPNGEFQSDPLPPGKYYLNVSSPEGSDFFATSIPVEIAGADITGVEIKLTRGLTVSGRVEVEDASAAPRETVDWSKIRLNYYVETGEKSNIRSSGSAQVQPDGSFRLTGLAPGTVRIISYFQNPKNLILARIERGGAAQNRGFVIARGEPADDVRLVFLRGGSGLRGEVRLDNGDALPEKARLTVFARPTAAGRIDSFQTEPDERGRFLLENLPAGEYQIDARIVLRPFERPNTPPKTARAVKTVTIVPGAENRVEMILRTEGGN